MARADRSAKKAEETSSEQQPAQQGKILLAFDQNELMILSEALVNMPFKVVKGLLDNIQAQINEQTK